MNALQKNRTETIARSGGEGKGHATLSNGRHWPRRRTLIKSLCTFPHSGAIAQLGERIVRNDEVVGSSPTSSTNLLERLPTFSAVSITRKRNAEGAQVRLGEAVSIGIYRLW